MLEFFEISIVTFLGLVFGSFATALSYRIPRGLSIVTMKRSHCPSCDKALGVLDLVPLFSWLFLRGKCRHCRAKIGVRYPFIELATLALCFLFYTVYGLKVESVLIFLLPPLLVALFDIDLYYKIIPDSFNLSLFLIGVVIFLLNGFLGGDLLNFIINKGGSALGGVLLYGGGSLLLRQIATRVLKREAMGLGDIKFYAAAGFWLGLNIEALSLFLIISGGFSLIFSLIWKSQTGEEEVPFGPSLMVGFITILCLYPPYFIYM